jgi:hypothetical protein
MIRRAVVPLQFAPPYSSMSNAGRGRKPRTCPETRGRTYPVGLSRSRTEHSTASPGTRTSMCRLIAARWPRRPRGVGRPRRDDRRQRDGDRNRVSIRGAERPPSWHRLGPLHVPSKPSSVARDYPARAAHNVQWVCPRYPNCGQDAATFETGPRVSRGPMRPTVRPQSTPCRLRFTLSQTRTVSAKRAEVHQNLSRRPSPRGTATRRWPVKCRRGHHGVQTRGVRAADHGIRR